MKFLILALLILPSAFAETVKTPTGIPLDQEWKKQLYEFAQKNVVHPAWGLAHGERNYNVTKVIALKEGFSVDEDVLFVAAFLHDIGGIPPFAKKGVDHAVRSVEVIEPLISKWGFPMEKWASAKEMILAHVYNKPAQGSLPSQAFRDADILDFLGAVGAARILAVTLEPGFANGTLAPTVGTLKEFGVSMAEKCALQACRELAKPRVEELKKFLADLDGETFQGAAL